MDFTKDFVDSLLTQNKNDLLLAYTLLANTNMVSLLSSSIMDKFKKTNNSFQIKIAEAAGAYADWSEEELTLQIITTLNKNLAVDPTYYGTVKDLYENGGQITVRTASVLREIDKKFEGSTFDDFMQYQYMKLFDQSLNQLESLKEEEQEKFFEDIEDFVNSLPIKQQERLKKEIGIEELTKAAINKSIINGSFGVGFASVVGIGGFPIYMAAASLVSSIFGVVGITLPFGFYVGMSSFIAVLANPLFLIPALGIGGFMLFKKGKEKLDRMLALIIITQITMANVNDEAKKAPNRGNEVIVYWKDIVSKYNVLIEELNILNSSLKKGQLLDSELQSSYQMAMKKKTELEDEFKKSRTTFKGLVDRIRPNELTICYSYESLDKKVEQIVMLKKLFDKSQLDLNIYQAKLRDNPKNQILLSAYKTRRKDCLKLQKCIDEQISAFITEIENKALEVQKLEVGGFSKDYVENYVNLSKQLNETVCQADKLNLELNVSKQKLTALKTKAKGIEGKIKAYNQQYYGIEKIHQFQEEVG